MSVRLVLTLFVVASVQGWAGAQEAETFPGTNLRITMPPSALTDGFRPLKLKEQSSGTFGDYYAGAYFQFGGLGISSDRSGRFAELSEILPVAWTKSEMVKVYGQEFVVTYILEPSVEDLRAFTQGAPLKNIQLKLKLMKADQIGSIEPYPELTRGKYLEIVARLSSTAGNEAAASAALSNVNQIAKALIMYIGDNDDIYPYVQSTAKLQSLTLPYTANSSVWKTRNPRSDSGTFRFNMALAGVAMKDVKSPAQTPAVFDPIPWPDGKFLVGYADGHAKFISPDEWSRSQKYLKLNLKRHGKPLK